MDSNNGGPSYDNSNRRKTAAEIAREKVLAVYSSTVKSLKKLSPDTEKRFDNGDEYLTPPTPGAYYSAPDLNTPENPQPTITEPTYAPQEQNATPYQNQTPYSAAADYDQPYYTDNTYNSTYSDAYQYEPNTPTNNTSGYDYTDETSALKDAPVNQTTIDDEWQKYHSAWQNYYQNYYSDYYAKAAQNYLATEKLKNERVASGQIRRRRRTKRLIPVMILLAVIIGVLFLQYNRLIFAPIMAYVSPNTETVPTSIEAVDPNITQSVSPEPRLIIPKLNIDVPVAFNIDYNDTGEAMNHGVAQFKIPGASALPGQIGNLAISGHSAGDIYSSNPYKFIFSGLERLEPGDLIYINYESKRYTYQMTGSEVVEPTDVAALIYETNKPILTLITCTPLGTSRYRLLVTAEQISPSYNDAPSTDTPIDTSEDANIAMPANEPSFFENIWSGIFGS